MSFIADHILSWITFLPLVGALGILLFVRRNSAVRITALVVTLADFVLALYIFFNFVTGRSGDQFVERVDWLFGGRVQYHLGCDGVSLLLVVLTAFLGPLVVLSSWNAIRERVSEFMAFVLILQTAMIGTFFARDMLLFYVFWETMLVPMYFLIGVWG